MRCECGAAKTGVGPGHIGHSDWCPARNGVRSTETVYDLRIDAEAQRKLSELFPFVTALQPSPKSLDDLVFDVERWLLEETAKDDNRTRERALREFKPFFGPLKK